MATPTLGSHQAQFPASPQHFPFGRAARGGWAQGLRLGHAQAYAALPGPSDLAVTRPPERSLGEGTGMKVV